MKIRRTCSAAIGVLLVAVMASSQAVYQPKFKGDPARSDSEAAALGYMRTFLRAQKIYKKKNGHYATTLSDLAKTGSFTKRMASSTDRGDTMVPKQQDATHRSFFSDEQGRIRADETKEADESSPVLKAD